MNSSRAGRFKRWGTRLATAIGWILFSLGVLVLAAFLINVASAESTENASTALIVAGVPMASGLWLVRMSKRSRINTVVMSSMDATGEDEAPTLRLPSWVYWTALSFGAFFACLGLAMALGSLIAQEAAVMFGAVVVALPAVPMILFGLRPWQQRRARLERGLPEGLTRRQRRQTIRQAQLDESRERTIEKYESRHAELIERLHAAGHWPQVHAVWSSSPEGGGGWAVILFCSRCGRKRRAIRKSRRLSPNHHCTSAV
jgi:hypothetical protein